MIIIEMNGANPTEVIKNLESIGLTSKYNSGSLTPMGLSGPVPNPFLGIPEPNAADLSPVIKGGARHKRRKTRVLTKRKGRFPTKRHSRIRRRH